MMYRPTVIVPPVDQPVSLSEAKDHLGFPSSTTAHDNKTQGYLDAATDYCQNWQNRTYFTTTLEFTYRSWPCGWNRPYLNGDMVLPRATPLQSVTSIIWKDQSGSATTMDPSTYLVDTDSQPGAIVLPYGQAWPSSALYPVNPIRVRYIAGHGAQSPPIPFSPSIKQAILFMVGHLFANREGVTIGTLMESKEMVMSVAAFLGSDSEPNSF